MAEQEPRLAEAPNAESENIAALKAHRDAIRLELERADKAVEFAEFELKQEIAFGRDDITVANEGEDTYQSYLDQRPSERVVAQNGSYRGEESGKFTSAANYNDPNGNALDYYDRKMGIDNNGVYEAPNYKQMDVRELTAEREKAIQLGDRAAELDILHEGLYAHMGVMQLAKEAALARKRNDTNEEALIRQTLDDYLESNALSDTTATSEQVQARYDADTARYDALVERFAAAENDKPAAPPEKASPVMPAAPVEQSTPVSPKAIEPTTVFGELEPLKAEEATAAEEETSATEVKPTIDPEAESGGYYNGKKVTVARITPNPDNHDKDELVVVDEEGTVSTIEASELEYHTSSIEEGQASKSWWKKAGDYIRPRAGVAFWAAKFETFKHDSREKYDGLLNHGVNETMTEEEVDKRRKRNRYVAIAAGAAIGIAAITIGGVLIANGLANNGDVQSTNGDFPFGDGNPDREANPDNGGFFGNGMGAEGDQYDTDGLLDLGGNESSQLDGTATGGEAEGVEVIPLNGEAAVETVEMSSFDVGSGEGGLSLFNRLGISPAVWYEHANTLVAQFPQDFELKGTDVRITHSGSLSQGAEDYINRLRQAS